MQRNNLTPNEFLKVCDHEYKAGKISPFIYQHVLSNSKNIISPRMLDEIFQDALAMGRIVNDEEGLHRYIGAQNVVPFFVSKLGVRLLPADYQSIYKNIIEDKVDDAKSVGDVVFRFVDAKRKVAYPMMRLWESNAVKQQNIEDWILRLHNIYKRINAGVNKRQAFDEYTRDFSSYERNMFESWVKYYEEGDHLKYSMGSKMEKIANIGDTNYLDMLTSAFNAQQQQEAKDDGEKKRMAEGREKKRRIKRRMLSRIRSINKLLHDYFMEVDEQFAVGPGSGMSKEEMQQTKQVADSLTDSLTNLNKEVQKLTTSSFAVDKIYKTASELEYKFGKNKVSNALVKIAQEFEGPAREADLAAAQPSNNLAGMKQELDVSGESTLRQIKNNANPIRILEKLETVSKFLKERSLIRELSEVDIMMAEVGMQSYFSEIPLAQSKMIDAFSYASSKIEEAVAKLRGGIEEKQKTLQPVPAQESVPKERAVPTAENVTIKKEEPPTGV